MDYLDDETRRRAVLEFISREIHLGEWCPERSKCSGTSGPSDDAARAALKSIRDQGLTVTPANPRTT